MTEEGGDAQDEQILRLLVSGRWKGIVKDGSRQHAVNAQALSELTTILAGG